MRAISSGWCTREVAELEAEDVDPLEQDQVQRDPRDGPRRVADGDEAAAPVQRAQRRLGQVAADRVDHDVGAVGERLPQGLPQVAGAVVDQPLGAAAVRRLELLGAGGHRGHGRPQDGAQLDRGRADAAARPEHDELLARLERRHRAQHVVRRAVGHAEAGRRVVVHPGRDRHQGGRRHDDLLGQGADDGRAEDAVADADDVDAFADVDHVPGELAAQDEGRRHRHLVRVRDDQHVGEVERADVHCDPGLSCTHRR